MPISHSNASIDLPLDLLPSHTVTTSGRDAFRAVLNNWVNRNRLILSSFTCDSVFNAINLEANYSVSLIDISSTLYPDLEELDSLTAELLSVSILIVGNLFGIPYPDKFKSAIVDLRGRGLIVIEDRTHNLFSPKLWLNADGWFASGRKWIPSAGLGIYSPRPHRKTNVVSYVLAGSLIVYRNFLMRVLHHSIDIDRFRNQVVRELRRTDKFLGLRKKIIFSLGTKRLMRLGQVGQKNGQRRCEKTKAVENKLSNIDGIYVLNNFLDPGSTPFNVTIKMGENRDELRAYLALRRIFLPILWTMPESFREEYPNSWKLSRGVLSIPVDHRYGLDHLEDVCNEISIFQSRK